MSLQKLYCLLLTDICLACFTSKACLAGTLPQLVVDLDASSTIITRLLHTNVLICLTPVRQTILLCIALSCH